MGGRGYFKDGFQASRVDDNQSEIVSAFRRLGYSVALLHAAGEGVFDLMIGKHGLIVSVEVKDGAKAWSARQFTKKQRLFNFSFQGLHCVVTGIADVMKVHEQFSRLLARLKDAGIKLEIEGCAEPIYRISLV